MNAQDRVCIKVITRCNQSALSALNRTTFIVKCNLKKPEIPKEKNFEDKKSDKSSSDNSSIESSVQLD